MSIFNDLFRIFVYEPQVNVFYLFYKLTNGDVGLATILMAIFVNLLILPLFAKNYINSQKTRILQPYIKQIQTKYKEDPQKLLKEIGYFNKKHGINNSYTFLVLFVQLFFVSGLYILVRDAISKDSLEGLYQIFWNTDKAFLGRIDGKILAFGSIDVGLTGSSATKYLYFPILTAFFSYLYGMYTFRWAPLPKIPTLKPIEPKKENKNEASSFDPEAMQKSLEVQTIYFMPLMLLFFQYNFPTGLNIYMATSSLLSLIRQIFLTNYYASHTDKLMKDIAESDPLAKDDNPDNNPEVKADPVSLANDPVPTKIDKKSIKKNIQEIIKQETEPLTEKSKKINQNQSFRKNNKNFKKKR
jgi:YidC/Oxa1 family membrane protein insertase